MQLLDARRLTGPSFLSRSPLVIVELGLEGEEPAAALDAYLKELSRVRGALGLERDVTPTRYEHRAGVIIGYEAPIDVMLACAEMSEWAALSACEVLAGRPALDLEPKRAEIEAILERDRSPRLLSLRAEAERRGLPFLWDDDSVSVGTGSGSESWPRASLPDPDDVDFDSLAAIPIALVTGTNGKTTSSRLLARIIREAGLRVGSTSSDEIAVGSEVIDSGDWTGPAAARTVLRRKDVDFAVLETARGGILRRGLAIAECDAALITNVSDDHLGSYGIDDLAAMTRVKAVVARAVRPNGTVVLNAHDPKLVALAAELSANVVFFADLERDDPAARAAIASQRASGKAAVFAEGGEILAASGTDARVVVRVDSVPITFGGAASYNVENVAGCVAMARALGIDDDAIVRAVSTFQVSDNPRRGELLDFGGVRVLLDFGHNPDGIRAVMQLVTALREGRPGRLTVIAGHAGDRSERDFEQVVETILAAKPDRVLLRELRGYLRGREPGEIPRLFERALISRGLARTRIATVDSEAAALGLFFDDAAPGDFAVLLVHLEPVEVRAFLDGKRA
jgi:cyanophycin synthetase